QREEKSGSDAVLCYEDSVEEVGTCAEHAYLGEGVTDIECCWNIKYSYKTDAASPCQACRPAQWSEWSRWSPCTVSCTEGVEIRRRTCIGQGDCPGLSVEVQSCVLQECCPGDGGWSEWSQWSPCSVTCEKGQTKRTRECNNPVPTCNGSCQGPRKEEIQCDTHQICPIHGSWSEWGQWGQCSGACITEGSGIFPTQTRHRICNNPPPSSSPPGEPCKEDRQQNQDCKTLPFCPVNGQWSGWKKVSECSVTCGLGRVKEERVCDNPAPKHRGKACAGSPTRSIICNTEVPCPIDGQWSEWPEWSKCERLRDEIRCKTRSGLQFRSRKCQGESFGGKWCEGSKQESRSCYNVEKCLIKTSQWSDWSPWSKCSAVCGKSEKSRERVCQPIYTGYEEVLITDTKVSEVFFSGTPKVKCDPINGETNKVGETTECQNVPAC
uniref:Properdin n=1 Tax=Leptobrachium leishanense TaxID=445787 RepID=A0A8C5QVV7_9ANUR